MRLPLAQRGPGAGVQGVQACRAPESAAAAPAQAPHTATGSRPVVVGREAWPLAAPTRGAPFSARAVRRTRSALIYARGPCSSNEQSLRGPEVWGPYPADVLWGGVWCRAYANSARNPAGAGFEPARAPRNGSVVDAFAGMSYNRGTRGSGAGRRAATGPHGAPDPNVWQRPHRWPAGEHPHRAARRGHAPPTEACSACMPRHQHQHHARQGGGKQCLGPWAGVWQRGLHCASAERANRRAGSTTLHPPPPPCTPRTRGCWRPAAQCVPAPAPRMGCLQASPAQ